MSFQGMGWIGRFSGEGFVRRQGGRAGVGQVQPVTQPAQLARQRDQLRWAATGCLHQAGGNGLRAKPQLRAGVGQENQHAALIDRAALAPHRTVGFKAFEQRRHGARIKTKTLPERRDPNAVLFPQYQQGQVLRIGQTQSIEQGLVEPGHCQ